MEKFALYSKKYMKQKSLEIADDVIHEGTLKRIFWGNLGSWEAAAMGNIATFVDFEFLVSEIFERKNKGMHPFDYVFYSIWSKKRKLKNEN